MYLIDANVISELRKGAKANVGVIEFFRQVLVPQHSLYLSEITIGELRRGVELMRNRRDLAQASLLESWLNTVCLEFSDAILHFDEHIAQVWGKLLAHNAENAIDKQIAATALIHDLTVVTRNQKHFELTGVRSINPFR